MRKYIDIIEDNGYDIEAEDAMMAREEKINKLIQYAFDRIGLPISDGFGIIYDESNEREATVTLEDNAFGYSISLLSKLHSSGLSDEYLIRPGNLELEITFKVKKELDNANI